MPQYDLLKQALSDAMQFNKQPTQYVDIFGNAMKAQREGIQHRQLENADELQTALQESMSGLGENATLDQIQENEVKVRSKYGDSKGAREVLQDIQQQQALIQEAKQKQADRLLKQLKETLDISGIDAEAGMRVRDMTGAEVSDEMIRRVNRENRRKGEGGSEKFKIFYDTQGNQVTVSADRASVDAALAKGWRTRQESESLQDAIDAIIQVRNGGAAPKKTGDDTKAREDARKAVDEQSIIPNSSKINPSEMKAKGYRLGTDNQTGQKIWAKPR